MMQSNLSAPVHSTQTALHPRLAEFVQRHLQTEWHQAPRQPTVEAFEAVNREVSDTGQKLVLDSGCGNGESTRLIGRRYPDCLVIGIDKSAARLKRVSTGTFPHREANVIWLRAELAGFWQLAVQAGWQLHRHFLLYPNPWPKPGQLMRRWHAHPVFPTMLRLGGRLEMRCNWEIYAMEFAAAIRMASGVEAVVEPVDSDVTTPFERKYRNSGHGLYTVRTPEIGAVITSRSPLSPTA
jgi:tRNA (guanine-N7-)-methyltransferase